MELKLSLKHIKIGTDYRVWQNRTIPLGKLNLRSEKYILRR